MVSSLSSGRLGVLLIVFSIIIKMAVCGIRAQILRGFVESRHLRKLRWKKRERERESTGEVRWYSESLDG